MEALIPGMLIWICLQLGCEPPPPPAVVVVSEETLLERVYGADPPAGPYVCGLYDDKTQAIWLPPECRADDLLDQSTLLHELVHHVQTITAMVYPCPPAREALAYRLQAQWLAEKGVEDPYDAMEVDPFTIMVRSLCLPAE
jgi:hypothetical protein